MRRLLQAMQLIGTTPSTTQDEAAATQPGSPLAAYIDTLVEEGELTIPDPLRPGGSYWMATTPALRHTRPNRQQHGMCVRWRENGVGTGRDYRDERRRMRAEIERNFSTLIAAIIVGIPVHQLSDGVSIPGQFNGLQPPEPEFVWQPDSEPEPEPTDEPSVAEDMGITEAPPRRREIIHVPRNTDVEIVFEGGMRFVYLDGQITTHYET